LNDAKDVVTLDPLHGAEANNLQVKARHFSARLRLDTYQVVPS
jgi:hypothetical protein